MTASNDSSCLVTLTILRLSILALSDRQELRRDVRRDSVGVGGNEVRRSDSSSVGADEQSLKYVCLESWVRLGGLIDDLAPRFDALRATRLMLGVACMDAFCFVSMAFAVSTTISDSMSDSTAMLSRS